MLRLKPAIVAGLVLGTTLVVGSVAKIHVLQDTVSGAQVLWHPGEAYLFIGTKRLGWQESLVRFLVVSRVSIYGDPPQDVKRPIAMVKITADGVERHDLEVVDNAWPRYIAFEGHIYEGGLSRWDGVRFRPTTPEERRRLADSHPTTDEFSDVDGWSNRYLLPLRTVSDGATLPIDFNGRHIVFKASRGIFSSSIEIQRDSQPPQPLWSSTLKPRFVTKSEYDAVFGDGGTLSRP